LSVGVRISAAPGGYSPDERAERKNQGRSEKKELGTLFLFPACFFGMKLAGFENLCLPQTDTGLPS